VRPPDFTLTAGPAAVSPRVLSALAKPVLYHYDPVFLETYRRTEQMVGQIYDTANEVILMQGVPSVGLEAAARALVTPGTLVLNLVSGVTGQQMGRWLAGIGALVHDLTVSFDDAVDPAGVAAYLDAHPDIGLVAVVHCESPSGTMNDCAAIGAAARERGVLTLVNCVSSLGGMPFSADRWQLDVCVGGAHKCLGGTDGISLMTVSDQAWAAIEQNPAAPRDSYMSLLDWHEHWHGKSQFPSPPSVPEINGLEAACDQLLEEGLEAAFARHELAARSCRAGVLGMGLQLWPARTSIMSAALTAIAIPAGLDADMVCDHVRSRYGVMISSGRGAGNLVRIGHMGTTATGMHPVVGVIALGRALVDMGVPVRPGDGAEAAMEVLAAA
jgi:pyridoxamine---pyruvate transaminase